MKPVNSHPEEHVVYYRQNNNPGALSAKAALSSFGYDFAENRAFPATVNREEGALDIVIPKKYLKEPY